MSLNQGNKLYIQASEKGKKASSAGNTGHAIWTTNHLFLHYHTLQPISQSHNQDWKTHDVQQRPL
ncbi:uncharacterized protein TrAtP1_005515 [Trichoderma atroviride]|uniref:uncharacterized protein n=1 Tax=Hypocrea atroviridis TaxID=63577 RepID=UPI00331D082C|nr:hypothetical protein TrAtP1_005515 [Trichoderma atroviride]